MSKHLNFLAGRDTRQLAWVVGFSPALVCRAQLARGSGGGGGMLLCSGQKPYRYIPTGAVGVYVYVCVSVSVCVCVRARARISACVRACVCRARAGGAEAGWALQAR